MRDSRAAGSREQLGLTRRDPTEPRAHQAPNGGPSLPWRSVPGCHLIARAID